MMARINPEALDAFVYKLTTSLGAPVETAMKVTSSLVDSDLAGHSSHGTRLLPVKYAPEIEDGKIVPDATPRIERNDGVFLTVDGQKSFGQVAARQAIDAGVERASENGVGVVALRNVSHIGRVGEWAERATRSEMAIVGVVSNPGSNWVAPPGSTQRRFSTNPVVVGIPTFDALPFPLVLDMATSQVARSKIRELAIADESLPNEWVVDSSGGTVDDGPTFEDGDGALLPLGGFATGHKGFGLAVMAELLAGIASDGSVSGMDDVLWGNHAVFYVTDISRWATPESISNYVSTVVRYIRETEYSDSVPLPWATHGERGRVPGEAEHASRLEQREQGLRVPEEDAALLRELAIDQGMKKAVPAELQ